MAKGVESSKISMAAMAAERSSICMAYQHLYISIIVMAAYGVMAA